MNKSIRKMEAFLLLAGLIGSASWVQSQNTRPENFFEYSSTPIKEGEEVVHIIIGGYRAEKIQSGHYHEGVWIPEYKYSRGLSSPEVWKHNPRTKEWVQLKPYDESWKKVPPMAGHAPLAVHIAEDDTVLYIFGGISSITAAGDTLIDNSAWRYSFAQNSVQKYDDASGQWSGVNQRLDEKRFPSSPDLRIPVPLFPNPGTGTVSFELPDHLRIASVKVYNQLGQRVMRLADPPVRRLDLSRQSPGVYYLRIDTPEKPLFGKIFKR